MDKSHSLDYEPPLVRGVISALDTFTDVLYKLSLLSVFENVNSEDYTEFTQTFVKALQLLSTIDENSPTEKCFEFIDFLHEIDDEKWIHLVRIQKETVITDFYEQCQRWKNLVKRKFSMPLQQWKETRRDALEFPKLYDKHLQELDEVKNAVEEARHLRDKMMPKQPEKREEMQNTISASEDFKSLHPFFIMANSEDHIEYFKIFREKKLQALQEQQKIAQQNFKIAVFKYKKEIQKITEETVKTKSLCEWLEEKNYSETKELEEAIQEEWHNFLRELEESRNLSKKYKEKNNIYMEIENEKMEMTRLSKMSAAASTLQAHWRDYMKNRGLRGDFIS